MARLLGPGALLLRALPTESEIGDMSIDAARGTRRRAPGFARMRLVWMPVAGYPAPLVEGAHSR